MRIRASAPAGNGGGVEFRAASQTCERTIPVPPLRVVVVVVLVPKKLIAMKMSERTARVNQPALSRQPISRH